MKVRENHQGFAFKAKFESLSAPTCSLIYGNVNRNDIRNSLSVGVLSQVTLNATQFENSKKTMFTQLKKRLYGEEERRDKKAIWALIRKRKKR